MCAKRVSAVILNDCCDHCVLIWTLCTCIILLGFYIDYDIWWFIIYVKKQPASISSIISSNLETRQVQKNSNFVLWFRFDCDVYIYNMCVFIYLLKCNNHTILLSVT